MQYTQKEIAEALELNRPRDVKSLKDPETPGYAYLKEVPARRIQEARERRARSIQNTQEFAKLLAENPDKRLVITNPGDWERYSAGGMSFDVAGDKVVLRLGYDYEESE